MLSHCPSEQLLKRVGVEYTLYRASVLEVFRCGGKAMTPQGILSKIRKDHPIDKVTLYRILDLFVDKKLLRRLSSTQGPLRYEIICEKHSPAHAHFACRICGDMECLNDLCLNDLKKNILGKRAVHHGDVDLKIEGLCSHCQGKHN